MPIAVFTLAFSKSIQTSRSGHVLTVTPADYLTFVIHIRDQTATYDLIQFVYHLLSRVGDGDISAHRHGLIGSCSSSFQYSA